MKIAVYGTGQMAKYFLNKIASNKFDDQVDIVYFVESNPTKSLFASKQVKSYLDINPDDFDFLVIAAMAFDEIVFFLRDTYQQYKDIESKIVNHVIFFYRTSKKKYQIVTTSENLHYLFDSNDTTIGLPMIKTEKTYSDEQIRRFFQLTEKHYGIKNSNGIFLDIGANIGTTSIYVKKVINRNLRVIGFEPGERNYKLFRTNCILNDVEDIITVNVALGDCNSVKKYYYYPESPGSSSLDAHTVWQTYTEDVKMITLDDYLTSNKVCIEDIDYIWIDAEGYESNIIKGAMKTLAQKRIPLMQEFNPSLYEDWDEYEKNIRSFYDNFIVVHETYDFSENVILSTSQLKEYAQHIIENNTQCVDLFFF